MKDTYLGRRLATIGLLAVLLVLAICSIGATIIVRQASLQASEAVHMNDLYQQAHYLVSSENSLVVEYNLQPDAAGQAEFRATVLKLNDVMKAIGQDGDAGDRSFVQSVYPQQAYYLRLVIQFFSFVDAHDAVGARTLHDEKIDPLFDPLDEQVGDAADADHQLAAQSLARADSIQRLVIGSTVLVFVLGLFLLLLFWRVMRGYQRRLNQAAQAELQRMEQAALSDPLTGLPNHRTLMDRLDEELERCQRTEVVAG